MSSQDPTYRLNWSTLRGEVPLWILILALLVGSAIIYPSLPQQVPIHWNTQGQVDNYGSAAFGAFFAPLLCLGIYLLMLLLPLVDPRRENYLRFAGAYRLVRWGLVLFFCGLHIVTLLVALGYQLQVDTIVKLGVGLLFLLIGNYFGQVRHNYFVGIKTPWTLASEEVWNRTHRFGGRIWVVCSLLMLVVSPIRTVWAAAVFFVLIVVMALVPIVYSYLLYQKIGRPV